MRQKESIKAFDVLTGKLLCGYILLYCQGANEIVRYRSHRFDRI